MQLPRALLSPSSKKKKKSTPSKTRLFQEKELSSPKIKKFLIFSQEKLFLYFKKQNFSGNGTF